MKKPRMPSSCHGGGLPHDGRQARLVKDPTGTKKIDDYWGPAQKQLLGDARFLQNLKDYDKDNMDEKMVVKVNGYTQMEMFSVDVVKKASIAAAGLCKWVTAMMI